MTKKKATPKRVSPQPLDPKAMPIGAPAYTDLIRSIFNERHFVLWFGFRSPDDPREAARVASVALAPETMGELYAILSEHVHKYEKRTGRKITPDGFTLHMEGKQSDHNDTE